MPDISAISAGLNALKSATDIVKYLRSVEKDYEQAEFKLKLAELAEALADVKLQLVEAQDENLALREQIRESERKRDFRSQLRLEKNVYIPVAKEIEGYGTGPWCSKCFDTQGILISLHHKVGFAWAIGDASGASYEWRCPNCKSTVSAPKP